MRGTIFFRELLKSESELSDRTIRMIGETLRMSVEEVQWRLQRPWGLKKLLMGKWPSHVRETSQSEAESRLLAALRIVRAIEVWGLSPERQRMVVERVVKALFDEALHRGSYAGGV